MITNQALTEEEFDAQVEKIEKKKKTLSDRYNALVIANLSDERLISRFNLIVSDINTDYNSSWFFYYFEEMVFRGFLE